MLLMHGWLNALTALCCYSEWWLVDVDRVVSVQHPLWSRHPEANQELH